MEQLLKMLQAAVETKSVSVTDIASHAKISRQHVYNILRGKSVPTLDLAENLADSIGLSLKLSTKKRKKTSG